MRNSIDRFLKAVQEYLQKAFTERVKAINEENPDIHLPDIALWQYGYSGVLSGLSHYPGCIVFINGRTLKDPYTTEFSLVIGIGITADSPDYLDQLGQLWEDILEDSIRSDWSLGGACLDTDIGVNFKTDSVNNVYLIQVQLACQVDIGGFVYADAETDKDTEGKGAILPMPEVSGSEGAVSDGEGDGVLPALRDADDAGDEGIGTEETSIQLEDEEE